MHPALDVFIEGWGRMGVHWGVGKMMAEIQALLYLSTGPLSLEDMSERLKTSRSNISLNVRALQDLGVVRKVIVRGDRKDYYAADSDLGSVARRLAAKKKKRELDPAIKIVNDAIRAAATTPGKTDPSLDPAKLEELKDLMEGIAGVFDAFIGHGEEYERRESAEVQAR
jgi:DNA-binding transcriptional regulator GbsR (MarR family)